LFVEPIAQVSVMRLEDVCWLSGSVAGAPVQPDAMPPACDPGVRLNVVGPGVLMLLFVTVNPVETLVAPAGSASDGFCGDTATDHTVVALTVVVAEFVVEPEVASSATEPPVPVMLMPYVTTTPFVAVAV
jgi:hypothetical protein